MIDFLFGLLFLLVVPSLAPVLAQYLGVRWRLAAVAVPIGFAGGGLMSRAFSYLSVWEELLTWGLLGLSTYLAVVVAGYVFRPWLEEQGWRW